MIIVILIAIISLGIISLIILGIYKIITTSRKTVSPTLIGRGTAKVVDKHYDGHTGLQYFTKTYPLKIFEEHVVYIAYKGKTYHIDDNELYKKLKIGDTVPILIYKGTDQKEHITIYAYNKNYYLS